MAKLGYLNLVTNTCVWELSNMINLHFQYLGAVSMKSYPGTLSVQHLLYNSVTGTSLCKVGQNSGWRSGWGVRNR